MDDPIYYRSLYSLGPSSFLFYIVARVGPGVDYRPLAVASCHNSGNRRSREDPDSFVPDTCLRVIRILCSAINRTAIEAERVLANSFHRNIPLERVYSEEESEANAFDIFEEDELAEDSQDYGDGNGIREYLFPFLSTCLLLGVSNDVDYCETNDARLEPLGTAYEDGILGTGMVVIDITDLDSIRYGIVAFEIHHMAHIRLHPDRHWDPAESVRPEDEPEKVLEEERLRIPLSADEYMRKFGLAHYMHSTSRPPWFSPMEAIQLIDPGALNFIWPASDVNSHPNVAQSDAWTKALSQQAIRSLINSTNDVEQYDMFIFATSFQIPGFLKALRFNMDRNPESLGPTVAAGQLLSLAYDGCQDLIWTPFKNLSFEAVAFSLESPSLQKVRSLALCVDRMQGDVDVLLRTLCARLDAIQQVCFLQDPYNMDDKTSTQIFLRISANPDFSQLLQSHRLTVTCSYSMPLRGKAWLPTLNQDQALPLQIYPVQQMFVRRRNRQRSSKFWPNYFYLGDGLMEPESLAFGFLNFLGSLCSENGLIGFSWREAATKADEFNVRVGPLLGEVSSIPLNPITTRGYVAEKQTECWSKPRDLVPGAWTILVSCDYAYRSSYMTSEPTHIQYAFVQAHRRIPIDATLESVVLKPDDVRICTVHEFIRIAGRQIDDEVVQRRIDDISKIISPISSKECISVFDNATAILVLKDFLEDARFIRDGLRFAIANQRQTEDCNWYPELLQGVEDGDVELPKRRSRVFQDLGNTGIWRRRVRF